MNPWNKGKKVIISPEIRSRMVANIPRGENHHNWKGGINRAVSGENRAQRLRFYAEIRKEVLKRDNYTCQLCSSKSNLQVDHIQSWAEYVELRFSMENCRTLCMDCHYQITFGRTKPEGVKTWGHNFGRRVLK